MGLWPPFPSTRVILLLSDLYTAILDKELFLFLFLRLIYLFERESARGGGTKGEEETILSRLCAEHRAPYTG